MAYRYSNLTNAVGDKRSPLRQYLDHRFPMVKPLQNEYREASGALLVDTGGANAGTLGAAFDFEIRFLLDPSSAPMVAALAFRRRTDLVTAIGEVVAAAQNASRGNSQDRDILARASWALALCAEVYRVGGIMPGSPLGLLLREDRFTAEELLALAPPDALRQLGELETLAAANLMPHLRRRPLYLGPTFEGSELCSADADLIAGGLLLDIKTHLGTRNQRTGNRSDGLALTALYQVVTYVLFDHSDAYKITDIGIYSARYGSLVTWPLPYALNAMADEPIDLAKERDEVWRLLGGA